jgi:hypothetical protein
LAIVKTKKTELLFLALFLRLLKPGEALKSNHTAALQELDRLFTSLQHHAFQGEL